MNYKSLIGTLYLITVLAISCTKEDHIVTETTVDANKTEIAEVKGSKQTNVLTDVKPEKGDLSCKVLDSSGETVCIGKRCAAPVGNCGKKKETPCKCIASSVKEHLLPEDMSQEQFQFLWEFICVDKYQKQESEVIYLIFGIEPFRDPISEEILHPCNGKGFLENLGYTNYDE